MNDASFLKKLSQVSMSEVIDFIEHNQTEITIKVLNQYLKTNIQSKKNMQYFNLPKVGTVEYTNEPVTCLFQVKAERYFFKSHLTTLAANCSILIPSEIFQLQRRNDYRVSMPVGTIYKCLITGINGVKVNTTTEIRDISLGGCQLSIAGITSDIKQNDELELYLKLDKFEFQKLRLISKHIKFVDTLNTTLIGASLVNPDTVTLEDLQAMLLHLDRILRGKG